MKILNFGCEGKSFIGKDIAGIAYDMQGDSYEIFRGCIYGYWKHQKEQSGFLMCPSGAGQRPGECADGGGVRWDGRPF